MTPKQVLILEDEPIIGFALEDMLLSLGCQEVVVANHLEEAEEAVRSSSIEAAILDVNIHGKRSYPVADMLADLELPYVFATGYGDTEHPERHRSAPTVTKPYSSDDIARALAAAGATFDANTL